MKSLLLSLALLLSGPLLAAPPEETAGVAAAVGEEAPAASAAGEESWYRIEMDDSPVGWMSERRSRDEEVITTATEMSLGLNRAGTEVRVAIAGRFVESAAGEPRAFTLRRNLGGTEMVTRYSFAGSEVRATTVQGGREVVEVLPLPAGDWLTPERARRETARRHRAGDERYTLRMLDPLGDLEPVTITRERIIEPAEELPAAGARQLWREEVSSAPGLVAIVETDESGQTLVSRTQLLGVAMTLTLTDRDTALTTDGELGPELFLSNLIRADRAIPAGARRAVYELATSGGSIPDLPSAGAQAAVRRGDRVRVTVTPGTCDADSAGGEGEGELPAADRAELLAPSVFLDHHDPAIREILASALGAGAEVDRDRVESAPADDPARTASRLTRYVHAYVRDKDLDSGLATASEVAATRSGDCTEHSVLLAALLRGAGIPSRLVSGLAYLDEPTGTTGVFGYHMWVQAWIGHRWRDFDPTLPAGYDAGHIALGTATFSGSAAGPEIDLLLPLLGQLQVRVLEVD